MDFNAGRLVDGDSMETLMNELFEEVIQVAEGKKLKHELNEFREMAIFKTGVTV